MWEVYSGGKLPYAGFNNSQVRLEVVHNNYRLTKPDECPENVFECLASCWEFKKEDRPTMADIEESMKGFAEMNPGTLEFPEPDASKGPLGTLHLHEPDKPAHLQQGPAPEPAGKKAQLIQLLEGARNHLTKTTQGTAEHDAARVEVQKWEEDLAHFGSPSAAATD